MEQGFFQMTWCLLALLSLSLSISIYLSIYLSIHFTSIKTAQNYIEEVKVHAVNKTFNKWQSGPLENVLSSPHLDRIILSSVS